MKKTVLAAAVVIAASVIGSAQAGTYKSVPYGNNPFLFCKYGMPSDGWVSQGDGKWRKIVKRPNKRWISTFEDVCSTSNGRDVTPDPANEQQTNGRDPALVP
ncbi:MAG: hypothetical protein JNM58_14725 [Xanthomonadaceae bacterium]|nr:hypothetical protein [Xanthomonadaceae bacterium]